MEYIKLTMGILFIIAFTWILVRNIKRSSILHAIIRVDTIVGMIVGIYLVLGFVHSVIS